MPTKRQPIHRLKGGTECRAGAKEKLLRSRRKAKMNDRAPRAFAKLIFPQTPIFGI
jgi:hypothetical protein